MTINRAAVLTLWRKPSGEVSGVEARLRKVEVPGELHASTDDVSWADGMAVRSPTNMGVLSRNRSAPHE